jgi:hypothetical protein
LNFCQDEDEHEEDERDEYVPSSRARSSPRPRAKAQRRAASGAADPAGAEEAQDAKWQEGNDTGNVMGKQGVGRSKVKVGERERQRGGARSRTHAAEALDLLTRPSAAACDAAGRDVGREAAAKRPRNTTGLVIPAARFGAGGEGGRDVDEEALARRQSRRANIGSKPAEWWVTSANANEPFQPESDPPMSGQDAAVRARGTGKGQGRGGGRGGKGGGAGGSGSGGGG